MSLSRTSPEDRLIEADRHELAERIRDTTRKIQALTAERDRDLVAAREAGLTYERIGELIGYTHRGARLVIDRIKARSRTADVA